MDAIDIVRGMPTVEDVRRLESIILAGPQCELNTQHIVHGKVSARSGLIPAGCVMTGALTKLDNVCVVIGDITVTTDDGPKRLTGFHVLPALAGAKRVGYAHADTWWVTLHHTELADIAAIEDEMTDESADLLTRRPAVECQHVEQLTMENDHVRN